MHAGDDDETSADRPDDDDVDDDSADDDDAIDAERDELRPREPKERQPKKRAPKRSLRKRSRKRAKSRDTDDDDAPARPRGRGPALLPVNPNGGFKASRMCQAETTLRAAACLAKSPLIVHSVLVALSGHELRDRGGEEFQVERLMKKWGYVRQPGRHLERGWPKKDFSGFYTKPHQDNQILLNLRQGDGHIIARLARGPRLIVFCSAGPLAPTKSSTESKQVNSAIGRASRWLPAKPDDVLGICFPRTQRFRDLATEIRGSECVGRRLGFLFLLVDRSGGFSGLQGDVA